MSSETSLESTAKQARHIVDIIDDRSREEVQKLIRNGDLLKLMMLADLDRVDRQAFEVLLNPPVSTVVRFDRYNQFLMPLGRQLDRLLHLDATVWNDRFTNAGWFDNVN